jgi:hypothetical protein
MKPRQSKYKPKHPKKGEYKEQNGRTHVQEDKKEPSKRANHKGNIRFLNPPPLALFPEMMMPSFLPFLVRHLSLMHCQILTMC